MAQNFTAIAVTQVVLSGSIAQTFSYTDLVMSSACKRPMLSPSCVKWGSNPPPLNNVGEGLFARVCGPPKIHVPKDEYRQD